MIKTGHRKQRFASDPRRASARWINLDTREQGLMDAFHLAHSAIFIFGAAEGHPTALTGVDPSRESGHRSAIGFQGRLRRTLSLPPLGYSDGEPPGGVADSVATRAAISTIIRMAGNMAWCRLAGESGLSAGSLNPGILPRNLRESFTKSHAVHGRGCFSQKNNTNDADPRQMGHWFAVTARDKRRSSSDKRGNLNPAVHRLPRDIHARHTRVCRKRQ